MEWKKVISFCISIHFEQFYLVSSFFFHSEHKADLTILWIKQYIKKERTKQKQAEYRKHRKHKPTFNVEVVSYNLKEEEEDGIS